MSERTGNLSLVWPNQGFPLVLSSLEYIYIYIFLVDVVPMAVFNNNTDLRVKFLFQPTHEGILKPTECQQSSYLLQVEITKIHKAITLHPGPHSCMAMHGHPLCFLSFGIEIQFSK